MTDKINMVINLSILALLIYLAIQVHQLKNPPKYEPAMMGMVDSKVELEYNIQTLLNNAIQKAIEAE
tara:strand:+ start:439 stop:639 length:201 start_codon:yes stop_codon:yes gene_type:complete